MPLGSFVEQFFILAWVCDCKTYILSSFNYMLADERRKLLKHLSYHYDAWYWCEEIRKQTHELSMSALISDNMIKTRPQ